MNKPITVKELKDLCEKQIKKGNGNSVIMISRDDEGNGYHYLWYAFTTAKEIVDDYEKLGFNENILECIEGFDNNIAEIENTIILG